MTVPTEDRQLLAKRLTEARHHRGLSQHEAARAIGLNRSSLATIETNRRNVSALELRQLAHLYHRPIHWFFDDDPGPTPTDPLAAAITRLTTPYRTAITKMVEALTQHERNQP